MEEKAMLVTKAIQYLAGVCDGATTQDGHGYNKYDAYFGHQLATTSLSRQLTNNEIKAAHKMVTKYKVQLSSVGIALPEVIEFDKIAVKVILGNVNQLWFESIPDRSIREMIKTYGYRWDSVKWYGGKAEVVDQLDKVAHVIIEQQPVTIDAEQAEVAKIAQPADIQIKYVDRILQVRFGYNQEKLIQFKAQVHERKAIWKDGTGYDGRKKFSHWEVPTRFIQELVALFPDAELDEKAQELFDQKSKLTSLDRQSAEIEVPGLKGKLMPFQAAGVQFVDTAGGRALIADEQGLGKTIEAIAYLQLHPELRPAVIVIPATLRGNWLKEINKWTNWFNVEILSGRKAHPTNSDIQIINWDVLADWVDVLNPKVVIADEAHYAKNAKAQRSKAMRKLSAKCEKVILMTGTPVTNRPAELWPLLNMIDAHAWPDFYRFAMRYCNATSNGYGMDFNGASNLDELHSKIQGYSIRRRKVDVLKELPSKRRAKVTVAFDDRLRGEYNRALIDARNAASRTAAEALVYIEKAKQVTAKAKLKASIEWIENFIDGDEKLVVFATHLEIIQTIVDHFGSKAVKLTGETPINERVEVVRKFQEDDNVRLFVGNIKAAGVGITLTAASNAAFIEFAWTPGDMLQAEDRIHRIGQDYPVTEWYLVGEDTFDDFMVDLIEEKAAVIDQVTDGLPMTDYNITNALLKHIINAL